MRHFEMLEPNNPAIHDQALQVRGDKGNNQIFSSYIVHHFSFYLSLYIYATDVYVIAINIFCNLTGYH